MAEEFWILDRIEGSIAILEPPTGPALHLAARLLPADLLEGDALKLSLERTSEMSRISLTRDTVETDRRRRENVARLERLQQEDPGGDIEL
jgi:hypothetical protein